jgi:formylglycine-generating enzyme required for sulfatase activity
MRVAKTTALAVITTGLVLGAGCELIGGFRDFSGAGGGGGMTPGTSTSGGTGPCAMPSNVDGGPSMVSQHWKGGGCFWIDETEVTVDQYNKFAADAGTPSQSDPCTGNTSYKPDAMCMSKLTMPPIGAQPVVCVDYCDAVAFCQWAGKHLCKSTSSAFAPTDPTSEWYAACSNNGLNIYPYGSMHKLNECQDGCMANCATIVAGEDKQCAAFCGALDMSGNAAEWVDECNLPNCYVRGGSVNGLASQVTCDSPDTAGVLETNQYRGFRCCADAP